MARKAFTDRGIAALKIPQAGQYDLYDARTSGLGIRVSYGSTRTFFLKYVAPDGRQRRKKLGRYPAMSLSEARAAALDYRHELTVEKTDPAERDKRKRGEPTFCELATDYVAWARGKLDKDGNPVKPQRRSWKEQQRLLLNAPYFKPFHNLKAVDIERKDVVARLQEIAHQHGGVQANRCLSVIRRLYNWAYRADKIAAVNPAHMVEPPHAEESRDRVYSADELARLWEAFGQQGIGGQVFRFAVVTGQRIGEVTGMRWNDIGDGPKGDTGKVWTLPLTRYKTARTHVVPLSPLALRILDEVPNLSATHVFASPKGLDQPVTVGDRLRKTAAKLSGVTDFAPHDLRRTLATNAGRLKFEPHIADRLLGHVRDDVSNTYNRYQYLDEKRALVEAWATHLEGIVGDGGNVVQLHAG